MRCKKQFHSGCRNVIKLVSHHISSPLMSHETPVYTCWFVFHEAFRTKDKPHIKMQQIKVNHRGSKLGKDITAQSAVLTLNGSACLWCLFKNNLIWFSKSCFLIYPSFSIWLKPRQEQPWVLSRYLSLTVSFSLNLTISLQIRNFQENNFWPRLEAVTWMIQNRWCWNISCNWPWRTVELFPEAHWSKNLHTSNRKWHGRANRKCEAES